MDFTIVSSHFFGLTSSS
ncbi:BnaC02g31240D [Brassica napus]|uniref:BnaC02g31240D protein n=1 Tax=Brassica napus TaxID=3708 RepID=A0A078HIQ4_BRANA|nr:BnaC02g31240D [Brassica napus]